MRRVLFCDGYDEKDGNLVGETELDGETAGVLEGCGVTEMESDEEGAEEGDESEVYEGRMLLVVLFVVLGTGVTEGLFSSGTSPPIAVSDATAVSDALGV